MGIEASMEKSFQYEQWPMQGREWGTLISFAKCGQDYQIFLQAELKAVRMVYSAAKCCNCCLLQGQMLMPRNLLCLTITARSQIWETTALSPSFCGCHFYACSTNQSYMLLLPLNATWHNATYPTSHILLTLLALIRWGILLLGYR